MIVFARLEHGLISEARRVAHVFVLPDATGAMPDGITALCGQEFPPGVLEHLPAWAGMPCLDCTIRMPIPT